MMKSHKPSKVVERAHTAQDDDALLAGLRALNVWDALGLSTDTGIPWSRSTRLFGNANIGNLNYTNLQVPGQIAFGDSVVTNWYARTNIPYLDYPELAAPFRLFLQHTYVTLLIGVRYTWTAPLFDLMRSWRGPEQSGGDVMPRADLRWPVWIPRRQNVSVVIDSFSSRYYDPGDFVTLLNQDGRPWQIAPLLWIHLEGVTMPEIPADQEGNEEADHAHWRSLVGRMMRLVTRNAKEVESTADHIATWLGVYASEAEDPAIKAAATVVADAVRERFNGRPLPPDGARSEKVADLDQLP